MAPILAIKDLSTHIQLTKSVVHAVGNVDLYIEAGETLGLVGESGCGKSMTGLSIMGLLPPGGSIVGGSIMLDGRELVGLPEDQLRKVRGNDIAMIFQDPLTSLDPTKTIGYQVAEPVRLHRGASKEEARKAKSTLRWAPAAGCAGAGGGAAPRSRHQHSRCSKPKAPGIENGKSQGGLLARTASNTHPATHSRTPHPS